MYYLYGSNVTSSKVLILALFVPIDPLEEVTRYFRVNKSLSRLTHIVGFGGIKQNIKKIVFLHRMSSLKTGLNVLIQKLVGFTQITDLYYFVLKLTRKYRKIVPIHSC